MVYPVAVRLACKLLYVSLLRRRRGCRCLY